jgi:NADPH:quinone reductase-like Zn-dependent oxidoreductase
MGLAVVYGVSMGGQMTMDSTLFLRTRGTVSGLFVFTELHKETAGVGLARLAKLVDAGVLKPEISLTASWSEAGSVARQLLDRAYPGKAVLRVE